MRKRIWIVSVLMALLLLASSAPAWADSPGMVTGGFHFTAAAFGMEGWMRFDVHATGPGDLATGWLRWQEYNQTDGWRRVVAHPICVTFGESEGAPAALIVVQIDSRSGWGDGVAGQYVPMWVRDGGTPGWNGDKFTTASWPPQDTAPDCGYFEPGFFFATIDEGDVMIHP